MSAPLEGIRVLDLTRVLAGPWCTMTLADLGADVVKVEPPEGDETRGFGPFVDGRSVYFMACNRGKRSIALDLKSDEGRGLFRELARVADVLVENYRPGVMARLGLADLHAENPRLVWCAISAFGQGLPAAGYDLVVQGMSGIPAITGQGGMPVKCGASFADLSAAQSAVQAILAALFRRERTGAGAFIDLDMLRGQRQLLAYHASCWLNAGVEPGPQGNNHPSIHPFGTWRCADGWLNICVGNDALFDDLCRALAVDWQLRWPTNASRLAAREELDRLLEQRLGEGSVAMWLDRLRAEGVPCGPMSSVPEALAEAEVITHEDGVRTMPPAWTISRAPTAAWRPPPALDQHRAEVLEQWLGRATDGRGPGQA